MRSPGTAKAGALLALALAAAGCAGARRPAAVLPPPPLADVELRLFLIGDAGHAAPRAEPVLEALARELARDPERSVAVFLGDNIYPRGLPAPGRPERREAERRLQAQIDAVGAAGARGVFLPGNHDWDRHAADGWNAVRRQAEYVRAHGAGRLAFLPQDGCPGPSALELGARLRLIALDTHWWLHKGPKPRHPDSSCPADADGEVAGALAGLLAREDGREAIVLTHHPPASGGGHGGHFGWDEHLFPLRAWKRWLWLPLPVIGSAYPLARRGGAFSQDAPAAGYRRMLAVLAAPMRERPPLVWAAGHEHSLQVLEGEAARHVLVSGAGYSRKLRTPHTLASTRFALGEPGFMRLDVGRQAGLRLAVLAVAADGSARERFAMSLQ